MLTRTRSRRDLLSRRRALRVIWELREGRLTFRALQEACGGVSPTMLDERLRELRASGCWSRRARRATASRRGDAS